MTNTVAPKQVPLVELCSKIGSGITPRGGASVYIEQGTALIRSQNVYNSQFDEAGLVFVNEQTAEKMKGVTVKSNDVLLNITGDSVARSCIVPEKVLPARVNQHVAIIRPDPSRLDPQYLAHFMVSPFMQATMLSWAGSGGTRKALTKTMIENFEVPVREISVQRRIAFVLSAYDDLIENNRRRIVLLENAARLLYREWFVHFRFPGNEHVKIIDGVPESFEVFELGDFCKLRGGNAFKTKFQGQGSGDYPFIKVRDMNSAGNSISITEADNWVSEVEAKEMKAKPFNPGTIFFAKIGEALKQNRVRIAVTDTIIDNNMMGAIPDKDVVSPAFLYFLLSDYDIASHASGAAIPFLSAGVLNKLKFPLPNNALRLNFDAIVEPILQQIANLQVQITTTARARDLILPRLMDGRLEI